MMDADDLARLHETAQRRSQRSGEVAPSEDVLAAHAAEWVRSMSWFLPYEAVLQVMIAKHNEHFMEEVVESGTLTDESLMNHVLIVSKLVVHRLIVLGAVLRAEPSEPQALDPTTLLLESIFNPDAPLTEDPDE